MASQAPPHRKRSNDFVTRAGRRDLRGDDATDPTLIGTVRGVGYKLLLEPLAGGTR